MIAGSKDATSRRDIQLQDKQAAGGLGKDRGRETPRRGKAITIKVQGNKGSGLPV